MHDFRDIIAVFENRRAMAEEVGGVSVARVHKWHQRNRIPADVDARLIPALHRRGIRVSYEDLAKLRAEAPSTETLAPGSPTGG